MEEKMARGAGGGGDDYSREGPREAIYGQLVNRPQKALNLREGLGIDSWRGRFT